MKPFFLRREGLVLVAISPFLLFPTVFIPGTAVALLLLIVLWLALWAATGQPWPRSPLNGALLLWAAAILVGILVSDYPSLTLPKTTGLLLGLAAVRYLIAETGDEKRWQWGVAAFFTVGLLIVTVGAISVDWQFEVPFIEATIGRLPPHLVTLPEGPEIGVHMNQLAGALLPYPLLFLSLLWGWKPDRHSGFFRLGLALLTILLLALLLLSQSRSGWLGFAAGLVGLTAMKLWLSFPQLWKGIVGIGVGLAAVFLIWAVLFTHSPTWEQLWRRPPQETAVGDLSTLDFRREVWLWGVTAVEASPLTGTGLGAFRRIVAERYPIAVPADFDIAHAHNIFLQTALDTGLPGLVAYIALLVIAAAVGWRAAKEDAALRPFILGLLAALIALHAYGLGDALAPGSKPAVLLWLILGLLTRAAAGFWKMNWG